MLIGHIGDACVLAGEIIIAYAVIAVHDRMRHEHKIDEAVYKTMVRERRIVIGGVVLLVVGFALRVTERMLS